MQDGWAGGDLGPVLPYLHGDPVLGERGRGKVCEKNGDQGEDGQETFHVNLHHMVEQWIARVYHKYGQKKSMLPATQRRENQAAQILREYLTPEEAQQLDRLLWSPIVEIQRYKADPVAFAREVLHMDLAPYQERALMALARDKRVAFRGPRGAGKSTLAAAAVLWFLGVFEECKIPTTTSAWRQLIEFLWPEIHKWAEKADWWRVGLEIRPGKELRDLKIIINKNRAAMAISSNNPDRIEGAHAPALLMVFDESKIIPEGLWDSAEGALGTSDEAYWLALSTPGDSVGRFYDIFTKRDRYSNWTPIFATLEECINAGRILRKWVEDCRKAWGETSVLFKRHVKGEFAEDTGDSLIQLGWIERANQKWEQKNEDVYNLMQEGVTKERAEQLIWGEMDRIGCDPARYGADRTGWAFRYGTAIRKVDRTAKEDTMETAGRLVAFIRENGAAIAYVDVNGLGAGVFDRTRELHDLKQLRDPPDVKLPAVPINTANATKARDKTKQLIFNRLRDYLWWHIKELLEDGEIALPPDEELTADLVAFKWTTTSTGKVVIEDKESVKKRLDRSPDTGDAVVLCFAPEQLPYKPLISFFSGPN